MLVDERDRLVTALESDSLKIGLVTALDSDSFKIRFLRQSQGCTVSPKMVMPGAKTCLLMNAIGIVY